MKLDYETLASQYSRFGYADFVMAYPATLGQVDTESARITCRMLLTLAPQGIPADSTDSSLRRAAFELSEQAIAFTHENYCIIRAPEFRVTGELSMDGQICYIDAQLSLEFTERP